MTGNSEDPQRGTPSIRQAGSIVPMGEDPFVLGGSFAADDLGRGLMGPGSQSPSVVNIASLLRFKWLMLGVFGAIAGIAIPCIWLFVVPKYKARGVVRVSPIVSRIAYRTEENGMLPLYQSYLNTQVSIIRSSQVLNWVLDEAAVQQTSWYNNDHRPIFGDPLTPLERLRDIVSVSPRNKTELIDVSASTDKPGDAQVIVNTVIAKYLAYTAQTTAEGSVRRTQTLRDRRVRLGQELKGQATIKDNVTKPLGTASPEGLLKHLSTQLAAAETALAQKQSELAITNWDKNQLSAADDSGETGGDGELIEGGQGDLPEGSPYRYTIDPAWQRQHRVVEDAQHKLNIARQRYGESHPHIVALHSDVSHEERLLSERERQLDREDPAVSLDSEYRTNRAVTLALLGNDRASVDWRIARLEEEIDGEKGLVARLASLKVKIATASRISRELAQIDRSIVRKDAEYDVVFSRLTQLELESNAAGRISIAGKATKPSRPNRDRRLLLSVMALFAAVGGGLGVGYLRSMLDPKIYEMKQVQGAVHAPFLGQLPILPDSVGLLEETIPLVAECMRMVRTALLERLQQSGTSVVLITSSSSRAGKTSVAILLAKSLGQLGKKTLLVEADLHRPSFSGRLHLEFDTGLAAVLTGTVDDTAAIVSTEVPNLDVLPAGVRPDNFSPELLANGVFSKCLSNWRKRYDVILIDSPPILPVADARILAGHADGTILVLRASHCRRDETLQAVDDLMAAGGSLLGTVLVGTTVSASNEYYPGYYSYPTVATSKTST